MRESAFARPHCKVVALTPGEYAQQVDYLARWWAGELVAVTDEKPLTQPPRLEPTKVRRKRRKPTGGFSVS